MTTDSKVHRVVTIELRGGPLSGTNKRLPVGQNGYATPFKVSEPEAGEYRLSPTFQNAKVMYWHPTPQRLVVKPPKAP